MSTSSTGIAPEPLALDGSLIPAAARAARTPIWRTGLLAATTWLALGLLTLQWPNKVVGFSDWAYTDTFGYAASVIAVLLAVLAIGGKPLARFVTWLQPAGQWLVAAPLLLAAWEILTAKLGLLPTPFFAPPQSLIEVYSEDWPRLGLSTAYSLRLLAHGFATGATVGFLVGVWIGWSRVAGYWVHPVLRFVGPIPASALLPLAFFFAPSSYAAAVFLIALATGFPVAVLTWSGVASVNKSYYDVARTLGATPTFLVLRVAIPAALPQVFVGLFMGLGSAFSVLVVAEMMGVKAGLGWYLQWAQGWAAYSNMYAALIVMAGLSSGLITLLFRVRDRALSWQKGTVKW
ncbi:NitT/TauT family transport system permease protein [Herbaspirillum sp. Sphag1AN]|uniref:ABC transporter permease n=1 Tax=unclassified Herbaspirillum TaxID=2624150 RepID=UPI00161CB774|nr:MULTISPECIES: ABC transporter permease subunit [unclassified Herbaspirillum]MBB3213217.1 NitT/TauT family transport system permease protein [Herbaspirillum sp. Sphag1AN]MBB3246414.1 NitT/TauT family transport system permease protein [Herbaspirillum sp. Sphag64]